MGADRGTGNQLVKVMTEVQQKWSGFFPGANAFFFREGKGEETPPCMYCGQHCSCSMYSMSLCDCMVLYCMCVRRNSYPSLALSPSIVFFVPRAIASQFEGYSVYVCKSSSRVTNLSGSMDKPEMHGFLFYFMDHRVEEGFSIGIAIWIGTWGRNGKDLHKKLMSEIGSYG